MSDLELQRFAERAEERMPLPDFAELDRRGHALRRRRRAGVAGITAACVLAAVGVAVLRDDSPRAVEPVRPPDEAPTRAIDYPGTVMKDLAPGTYSIAPSTEPGYPFATITLSKGWNAWEGPNRFDGLDLPGDNEGNLGESSWYAGILVLKVDAVTIRPCQNAYPNVTLVDSTAESLVRAIGRIRGYRMSMTAEPVATFGYPATHFQLVPEDDTAVCDDNLFTTELNGVVGGSEGFADVWVVDVDGYPVVVEASRSVNTPASVRREMYAAVDSIDFHFPEPDKTE